MAEPTPIRRVIPVRRFNTAGPCDSRRNYVVPAIQRLPDVRRLIEERTYFGITGPAQCGKTTAMRELARDLTAEGKYAAVLVSVEVGAPFSDREGDAEAAILSAWRYAAEDMLPAELLPPAWPDAAPGSRILGALKVWARACPRPLVLFVDEMDALQDRALISMLRQLRAGSSSRPEAFPDSIALISVHGVTEVDPGGFSQHGGSTLHVLSESLTLGKFTRDEVASLLDQHTSDTGHPFPADSAEHIVYSTKGEPAVVGALIRHLVETQALKTNKSIAIEDVDAAAAALNLRRYVPPAPPAPPRESQNKPLLPFTPISTSTPLPATLPALQIRSSRGRSSKWYRFGRSKSQFETLVTQVAFFMGAVLVAVGLIKLLGQ